MIELPISKELRKKLDNLKLENETDDELIRRLLKLAKHRKKYKP